MQFVVHFPILLNVLGHAAGITAFGAFMVLLFRSPRPGIRAPAAAAGLALCWNLGSLVVLLAGSGSPAQELVATVSLAVLSLLPCTLLQLALQGDHKWLNRVGYAIGASAATIHISNALGLPIASQATGISAIMYGFSALAVVGAVLLARYGSLRRGAGMRFLAAMALFLLAVSFVHFGRAHESGAWLHELVFHHAGIPLALFVLLQDYRFLLLDVFVRLAGAGLLAAAFAISLLWIADSLGLVRIGDSTALGLAVFVVVSGAVILAYPPILQRLGVWVENALFRRKDVRETARAIHAADADGDSAFLDLASRAVSEFVSAERWKLLEAGIGIRVAKSEVAPAPHFDSLAPPERAWAEAIVPLRDGAGTERLLLLGAREGGRRYLSLDLAELDLLASEIRSRVERMRRDEQENSLRDAEMATLRAQINPHFLFNAFNALNAIIPASARDARSTLLNLADIFRYSLDGRRQFVPLEEEMGIVEAYLQIERLRLGKRLKTRIDMENSVRFRRVPALSIQPLVENAVKHGISRKAEGGEVSVRACQEGSGLRVEVVDNGPGFDPNALPERGHGLRSVERRLQLCFAGAAEFLVQSGRSGSTVGFVIRAEE